MKVGKSIRSILSEFNEYVLKCFTPLLTVKLCMHKSIFKANRKLCLSACQQSHHYNRFMKSPFSLSSRN